MKGWVTCMRICGLQKLAMVDFPEKLAATVFTGGCNLRCPFCHNALLVTRLAESPSLSEEEILTFLSSRKKLLDGMVLSGGEPLMQPGCIDFLQRVRDLGLSIKVDTNGCYPEILHDILNRGLADYVAMDIKNSREKYAETVGIPNFDLSPIEESIQLLKTSGVDYEFRTTVVQEFHSADDIRAIGQWIQGAPVYALQNFVDSGNLISGGLHPHESLALEGFARIAAPFFRQVLVRGV